MLIKTIISYQAPANYGNKNICSHFVAHTNVMHELWYTMQANKRKTNPKNCQQLTFLSNLRKNSHQTQAIVYVVINMNIHNKNLPFGASKI